MHLPNTYYSFMRYVLNNFVDGDKQDAYALMLGYFTPSPTTPPLIPRRTPDIVCLSVCVYVCVKHMLF